MLKLLKFELLQNYRSYLGFFGVFLALCLVVPVSNNVINSELFNAIISSVLVFLGFGITIGLMVNVARSYYQSMFGKAAYLTVTLPVSTHQLILSKLLGSLIWLTISGFILFLGFVLFMVVSLEVPFDAIINGIKEVFQLIGHFFQTITAEGFLDLIKVLAYFITGSLSSILLIYMAASLASTSFVRKHRVLVAVIIFFLVTAITGAITSNVLDMLVRNFTYSMSIYQDGIYLFNDYVLQTILVNVISIIVYYTVTYFAVEKKIEIQ